MIAFGTKDIGRALAFGALLATLVSVETALAQPKPSAPPPSVGGWRAATVAQGIRNPWGIAWLRDGTPLVTGKYGKLYTIDGGRFKELPIEGLPSVFAEGQGGLFDIAIHPEKSDTPRVYMTMSTGTKQANHTILVQGRFNGRGVTGVRTIFEVVPKKSGGQHFGSRLLWLPDGTLLMSVGDGGNPPLSIGGMLAREQAQNTGSHLGSVLRLTDEGKPPADNPFVDKEGAKPELWAYGNRNIQGLTREPKSGRVWANEHGPLGGDELNLIERGQNYGWPLQTFGRDYRTGETIGRTSVPGMIDPKVAWVPAAAPSGLAFYTGEHFPKWQGSLFSGGLVAQDIRRIALDGDKVVGQERLVIGARVRDVKQGPDGYLYVLTDEENGRLLRIVPE